MEYQPKDFSYLLGTTELSDELLQNHFKLYEGYVTNVNKLNKSLQELLSTKKADTPEFGELKRRFGWEYNGMRLHEMYFENLGGTVPLNKTDPLSGALKRDFGSLERWQKEFEATAAIRGIGWVVLYKDQEGKLMNVWVNEHDMGHLAGSTPLLVLDVWEHAYMLDYGIKRVDYIAAFMQSINWSVVCRRDLQS